jgi:ATP-binding cassette subfamily B protein
LKQEVNFETAKRESVKTISLPIAAKQLKMASGQKVLETVGAANGIGSVPALKNGNGKISKKEAPVIIFDDVTFGYRGGPPVVKDLNLEIFKNEKTCLIGKSGAGKSTIIRLVLGMLTPQKGRIIVDSENLLDCEDLNAYRKKFGVVSQTDVLFEMSIRENLLFGLTHRVPDDEMLDVLEMVDLKEKVTALDKGLDSTYYESLFSGGQKQRFTIARALIRKPEFVLMDEPTSALDFENEEKVLNSLSNLTEERTTITVAHRLSTIKSADRVFVLENGAIDSYGRHEELYKTNEYYRSLCNYNSFIV